MSTSAAATAVAGSAQNSSYQLNDSKHSRKVERLLNSCTLRNLSPENISTITSTTKSKRPHLKVNVSCLPLQSIPPSLSSTRTPKREKVDWEKFIPCSLPVPDYDFSSFDQEINQITSLELFSRCFSSLWRLMMSTSWIFLFIAIACYIGAKFMLLEGLDWANIGSLSHVTSSELGASGLSMIYILLLFPIASFIVIFAIVALSDLWEALCFSRHIVVRVYFSYIVIYIWLLVKMWQFTIESMIN